MRYESYQDGKQYMLLILDVSQEKSFNKHLKSLWLQGWKLILNIIKIN